MKEISGNLWDFYNKSGFVVMITTNGTIKSNGEAVMGRGCALEATRREPGVKNTLGNMLLHFGNGVQVLRWDRDFLGPAPLEALPTLMTFPVKRQWWEQASIPLMRKSVEELDLHARTFHPELVYVLPRPGCGNGKRTWREIKPLLTGLPDNVWVIDFERGEENGQQRVKDVSSHSTLLPTYDPSAYLTA